MNVFADLHHGDLYYSLHLLFEKRLGMNLYRPIGLDWFKKGLWKIAEPYGNPPDTIGQYLNVPSAVGPYNIHKYGETQILDDVYHIPTKTPSDWYIQKAITLEKFLKMDIDYVLATYDRHEETYSRLVSKYKPNATFIFQMGNIGWQVTCAKNILLAVDIDMPNGINYIKYHPEHHEDYCYTPPTNHNVIKSFINCMTNDYPEDLAWFTKYERLVPELTWKMHGILGRDGVVSNDLVPQAMKDSAFIWHVKSLGSCGFIPRQAMACGRPVITRTSYAEKWKTLARGIYEDSINCIDLDAGTERENIEKIKYFMRPENHIRLCETTNQSFKQRVDLDEEAKAIKIFLEGIKGNEVIRFRRV